MYKRTKRLVFLMFGHASVFLGVIGIFLPILPTTPFLILASFCYAKSSVKFHQRLHSSKFGPALQEWEKYGAISSKAKCIAVTSIIVSISCSLYFVPILWVKFVMGITGIIVSLYIISRPSHFKNKEN